LTRGISKSFNFVLRTSDSVRHSFNFVFDRIRSVMASADDNAAQLPADSAFVNRPVVLSRAGLFAAYLAAKVRDA
jgi:hypothetical protein